MHWAEIPKGFGSFSLKRTPAEGDSQNYLKLNLQLNKDTFASRFSC